MEDTQYKNFTETDFETVRESVKTFLKSQDTFKDYNFDGSGLSTLLDVLAYNTQYNAYYLNMMASEKFLNRAQKRKNIVELANNYGYVPYSAKSSTSYLSFEIIPESTHVGNIILPKNLKFNTSYNGKTYSFLSTQTLSVPFVDGKYVVTDYEVKEGRYFRNRFPISTGTKFYTILNANVDIDRLKVYIKPAESAPDSSAIEYSYYESILDVDANSLVYYIQETENEKFEIYFGDNILGKTPSVGSQVIIDYYVTTGNEANGANSFVLTEDVTGLEGTNTIVAERASNGAKIETPDSVRLSAKDKHRSQNRAVIESDFKVKVKKLIPDASDISVWGGENATPKQYGKVFVSVIKENLQKISSVQKSIVLTKLKEEYMVMGITPEIVDYDSCNLVMTTNITKIKNPSITDSEIRSIVTNKIEATLLPTLSKFNAQLYESKIEEFINYADKNIVANITRFALYKNIDEVLINNVINKIQFPVGLTPKSVKSSLFPYNNTSVTLGDDGIGNISIYNADTIMVSNIASIDYGTGIITINNSKTLYDIVTNKGIRLFGTPTEEDITVSQNYIVKLASQDILVYINE